MKKFFLMAALLFFSSLSAQFKNDRVHNLSDDLVNASQTLSELCKSVECGDKKVYTVEEVDEAYFPAIRVVLRIVSDYEKSKKLPDDYVCLKNKLDSIFYSFNEKKELQEFLKILKFLNINHIEKEQVIIESQDERLLVVPKRFIALSQTVQDQLEDCKDDTSIVIALTYNTLKTVFDLLSESALGLKSLDGKDVANNFYETLVKKQLSYNDLQGVFYAGQFLNMPEPLLESTTDYLAYRGNTDDLQNNDQLLQLLDDIELKFPEELEGIEKKLIVGVPDQQPIQGVNFCGFSFDGKSIGFSGQTTGISRIERIKGKKVLSPYVPCSSDSKVRVALENGCAQITFDKKGNMLVSPMNTAMANIPFSKIYSKNGRITEERRLYGNAIFLPNGAILKPAGDPTMQNCGVSSSIGEKKGLTKLYPGQGWTKFITTTCDDKYIVVASTKSAVIGKGDDFEEKRRFAAPNNLEIKRVFISPQGESLGIVFSNDELEAKQEFELHIYDIKSGKLISKACEKFNIYALAFVNSGKIVIFSLQDSGEIQAWNLATQKKETFYKMLSKNDNVLGIASSSCDDLAWWTYPSKAPCYLRLKDLLSKKKNLGVCPANMLYLRPYSCNNSSTMEEALRKRKEKFAAKYPKVNQPQLQYSKTQQSELEIEKPFFPSSSKKIIENSCAII